MTSEAKVVVETGVDMSASMSPRTSPGRERSRLVASIAARLGSEREAKWIVDHGGIELAPALADRRAAGEPLQYVLGRWPFRSVELRVDPRVLIPRPETEQVVEVALGELDRICRRPGGGGPAPGYITGDRGVRQLCVDLGTGSGAIALSLAKEGAAVCPALEVWATDQSVDALVVARQNLDDLAALDPDAAGRVRLVAGSWFDALPPELLGRVDLLVSNPPYVSDSEFPGLDPVVREWEPRAALVAATGAGGVEGMAAIEAIVAAAPRWLSRRGAMIIECAPGQAQASMHAALAARFDQVTTQPDLAGRLRMLVVRS